MFHHLSRPQTFAYLGWYLVPFLCHSISEASHSRCRYRIHPTSVGSVCVRVPFSRHNVISDFQSKSINLNEFSFHNNNDNRCCLLSTFGKRQKQFWEGTHAHDMNWPKQNSYEREGEGKPLMLCQHWNRLLELKYHSGLPGTSSYRRNSTHIIRCFLLKVRAAEAVKVKHSRQTTIFRFQYAKCKKFCNKMYGSVFAGWRYGGNEEWVGDGNTLNTIIPL